MSKIDSYLKIRDFEINTYLKIIQEHDIIGYLKIRNFALEEYLKIIEIKHSGSDIGSGTNISTDSGTSFGTANGTSFGTANGTSFGTDNGSNKLKLMVTINDFYTKLNSILWENTYKNNLYLEMYNYYLKKKKNGTYKDTYIYSIRLSSQAKSDSDAFATIQGELNPLITLVIFNPYYNKKDTIEQLLEKEKITPEDFFVNNIKEIVENQFFNIRILYNNKKDKINNKTLSTKNKENRFYFASTVKKGKFTAHCFLTQNDILNNDQQDGLIYNNGEFFNNCLQKKNNIKKITNRIFKFKKKKNNLKFGTFEDTCYKYDLSNNPITINDETKHYNFNVLRDIKFLKFIYSFFSDCKNKDNFEFDSTKFSNLLTQFNNKNKTPKSKEYNKTDLTKMSQNEIIYKENIYSYSSNKITVKIKTLQENEIENFKIFIGYLVQNNLNKEGKCEKYKIIPEKQKGKWKFKIKCY